MNVMNTIFKHIFLLTLALSVSACSGTGEPSAEELPADTRVYFNVSVRIDGDAGTRSFTDGEDSSSDGEEEATAAESRITRAVLVLRPVSGEVDFPSLVLPATLKQGEAAPPSADADYTLTASVSLEEALDFRQKAGDGSYEVLVLANHPSYAEGKLRGGVSPEELKYSVSSLTAYPLSAYPLAEDGVIPMGNAARCRVSFADWTRESLSGHISDDNPLYLTESPVLLERSVARVDYRDKDRASIPDGDPEKAAHTYRVGDTGYVVRLESLCPVNVSKSFYAFRHIKETDGSIAFLGKEKPDNYFLDTDDAAKLAGETIDFINGATKEAITVSGRVSVFSGNTDMFPFRGQDAAFGGYTPWLYIPENTVSDPARQLQGICTGIVFRFRIVTAPEGADVYQEGDFLDYYYFIRHNDNGSSFLMGPMEFGVVRNNIYKLCVESISGLPEPYNPENPAEGLNLFVSVKKWHVKNYVYEY